MFKLLVLSALVAVACATDFDNKIVGGHSASIADYPYQVSLQVYGQHFCGGSIVGPRKVITAAHCTEGVKGYKLTIRAGSSVHSLGGQVIPVAKVDQHSKYSGRTYDNDVSILTLAYDLEFDDSVQPIELESEEPTEGTATITGWGHTRENGNVASQLQVVQVPIISRKQCESFLPKRITKNMICAGLTDGGKDACQGDSGGPLAVNGKLAGVVSWGIGCARPHLPGIYSNVAELISAEIEFN